MSGEIVVYQWNVVCYDSVTLKNVSQFVWSPDTPKECPCNILTHTFVESLIISTVSTKDIFVKNDKSATNGYFRLRGYNFNISAGPDLNLMKKDQYTFLNNVRVIDFIACFTPENVGDTFSVLLNYNTIVGIITSDVSNGFLLNVSINVIKNIKVGFLVTINGSSYSQELYECVNVDVINNTITVEKEISNIFLTGNTIGISIPIVDRVYISIDKNLKLGGSVNGNILIKKGKVLSIFYQNMSNQAKNLRFIGEMFV